jgi:hypothetical protein
VPTGSIGLFVLRGLTVITGCLGLFWCAAVLPRAEVSSYFQDFEPRLLLFENFDRAALMRILANPAGRELSPCDTHSQRAMLLMELQLTETALQSGDTNEFDRVADSLGARSREILSCAPRDSFAWLAAFDQELLHGRVNAHSFDLLAMSYETSPNEAWISIRRTAVALPLALIAPEPAQRKILSEFQQLIRHEFVDVAARAYSRTSAPTRALLQTQVVAQLDSDKQKAFAEALQKLGS